MQTAEMSHAGPTAALREARNQLRATRLDQEWATHSFKWPDTGPRFNFVHDWFDSFARDNDQPGLVSVEEDGTRASYSFHEVVSR
ncbi:hypothetical protein GCM10023350_40860 [Nocardioides endophyticus]|uniref:Uncharacterized protein n=1 Tax=Nocardioides endophyticus TaxID=1353775 RepID=A0ABP8ZBT3_9ACTN